MLYEILNYIKFKADEDDLKIFVGQKHWNIIKIESSKQY